MLPSSGRPPSTQPVPIPCGGTTRRRSPLPCCQMERSSSAASSPDLDAAAFAAPGEDRIEPPALPIPPQDEGGAGNDIGVHKPRHEIEAGLRCSHPRGAHRPLHPSRFLVVEQLVEDLHFLAARWNAPHLQRVPPANHSGCRQRAAQRDVPARQLDAPVVPERDGIDLLVLLASWGARKQRDECQCGSKFHYWPG